jgi:NADH:ubiquinone oxidoreductase subunit F (NADH-binding)
LVARFGAAWYRGLGAADEPGTILVTFTGDVARPGVYELPTGTPVAEALRSAGAGADAKAVLIGGYSGTWVSGAAAAQTTLDAASLARVHASLGCGAISVLGPGACGLQEVAAVTTWLAAQSAGQCGPCVKGLPAIAAAVDVLVAGDRGHRWEKQLRRWLDMVEGRGACHHPDGVAHFVRSALTVFAREIERHRQHGPCHAHRTALPMPATGRGGWR